MQSPIAELLLDEDSNRNHKSWPDIGCSSSDLAYGRISSLSTNFITQPYGPLTYIFYIENKLLSILDQSWVLFFAVGIKNRHPIIHSQPTLKFSRQMTQELTQEPYH